MTGLHICCLTSKHRGMSVQLRSVMQRALKHEMACQWAVVMSLQVLIGGGQDAADVTTTSDRAGGFQSRFFHKVSPTAIFACPAPLILRSQSGSCCMAYTSCALEKGVVKMP